MIAPLGRISVDSRVCGGQPRVRGLRIPVALVLRHLAAGQSAEQIVAENPELEPDDIRECLRNAAWLRLRAHDRRSSGGMSRPLKPSESPIFRTLEGMILGGTLPTADRFQDRP
jgi:uncharacterized protein (DUF433 family)